MEFGPEIKVDGKRPEWLGDGDERLIPIMSDGRSLSMRRVWAHAWDEDTVSIRLPATHPHYATPTRTPLEDRMVALVKDMAAEMKPGVHYVTQIEPLRNEARAILAEMEPVVDPDIQLIAEAMARVDLQDWADVPEGKARYDSDGLHREDYLKYAKAIRGRQLEKEGK